MNRNKALELIFKENLNRQHRYGGWDYYYSEGESVTISICPSALAFITREDQFAFEYVFDRNGKYLGVQEEFTLNVDFRKIYWFFTYEDFNMDVKVLYYHKNRVIKLIRKFNGFGDVNESRISYLKNPDKLKVEWYDEKNKLHTAIFYPDGSSIKTRKNKSPSQRQMNKKFKEMKKEGMFL